jgi:hypothetical protein
MVHISNIPDTLQVPIECIMVLIPATGYYQIFISIYGTDRIFVKVLLGKTYRAYLYRKQEKFDLYISATSTSDVH